MNEDIHIQLFLKCLDRNNIMLNIEDFGLSRSCNILKGEYDEDIKILGDIRISFNFFYIPLNKFYKINEPFKGGNMFKQAIKIIKRNLKRKGKK